MPRLRRHLPPLLILLPLIFLCGKLLLTPGKRTVEDWEVNRTEPVGYVYSFVDVAQLGWPWAFLESVDFESLSAYGEVIYFSWILLLADIVVLALAAVAIYALLLRHRKRNGTWLRFTLRALLTLTAMFAIGCGWYMHHLNKWRSEQRVGEQLASKGIQLSGSAYRGPEWLRRLWPEEKLTFFHSLVDLEVAKNSLDHSRELEQSLTKLPHVRWLESKGKLLQPENWTAFQQIQILKLSYGGANNDTLLQLRSLTQLRYINLDSCSISDQGLADLAGCSSLTCLSLANTNITDAGLAHLTDLPQLRTLCLSGTNTTDDGVAHLARISTLGKLDLWNTNITDKAIDQLMALPNLEVLNIGRGTGVTRLTDDGIRRLVEMPKLKSVNVPYPPQTSQDTIQLLKTRISNVQAHH